jgi:hypothetical protein
LHLEPSFNFLLTWDFIRNLLNRPHCTPKFQQLSSLAAARLELGYQTLSPKNGGYGFRKWRDCAVAAALGMEMGRG